MPDKQPTQWMRDAAEEIYWAEGKKRSSVSWCNINDIADILAKHSPSATESEYPKPCGICAGVIQSKDDLDWHGYGNCREVPDAMLKQLSPLKDANDALLLGSHRDKEGDLVIYLYRAQEIAKELARHSFGDGTQSRAEDKL